MPPTYAICPGQIHAGCVFLDVINGVQVWDKAGYLLMFSDHAV